jgi:hypothetical protein
VHRREAFLLPEYELWYPGVRSGIWLPAELVAHTVQRQLLQREPRWAIGSRVLSDVHFQFRGGHQEHSRLVRKRQGERSVLHPRLW